MIVVYMWCKALEWDGTAQANEPAGYLIATDYEVSSLDYENLRRNECVWIVPGTEPEWVD